MVIIMSHDKRRLISLIFSVRRFDCAMLHILTIIWLTEVVIGKMNFRAFDDRYQVMEC